MSDRIDLRELSKRRTGIASSVADNSDAATGAVSAKPGPGVWGFLNKDIRLFGSALPDKIKEAFYLELSTLLSAGMDIRAALELIEAEQPKKKYADIFHTLLQQIVGGLTLSSAMKDKGIFTPYEYYSVLIGEETGKLVVILSQLASYYRKKI